MKARSSTRIDRAAAAGFTLLEVLVAMSIISLGLIGVFGSLNQMLGATALLRDKTLATWIATDRITEMRVNGEYPDAGEREDAIDMAGAEWIYTIKIAKIPDMAMRRLDVSVGFADDPGNTVATVIGFLPQPQAGGENDAIRKFGEGYAPLDPNTDYSTEAPQ